MPEQREEPHRDRLAHTWVLFYPIVTSEGVEEGSINCVRP